MFNVKCSFFVEPQYKAFPIKCEYISEGKKMSGLHFNSLLHFS